MDNELVEFNVECPHCYSDCSTFMKKIEIPMFKEVIIMSTVCDVCGAKSNEVKSGTGVLDKGIKFTLKLTDTSDLTRDILKSNTASLEIPEIEFYMDSGTMGGKITTLEGLLKDSHSQLSSLCCYSNDDETASTDGRKIILFLKKLEKIYKGERLDVTIILDDPSGNSYLQNFYAPSDDPNLTIETYERDFEQNDLLGLNDIKTENY